MRYARLFSWLLFVVFFLVYLTAIRFVRGQLQPAPQLDYTQLQSLHPFYGHTFDTQEASLLKQAHQLAAGQLVDTLATPLQSLPATHQQLLAAPTHQAPPSAGQHQPIARRQHLVSATQHHSLHPFVASSSSVASSRKCTS